ncbi:protein lin-41-like [Haliotis rufescens]|uniref:protein lin-41-like n=1 Tax=Haliotis rufescens TaxID=6454 RepID=UPI00201F5F9D|nr:protein lin-41-like [Haliotis rufescens]
MVDTTDGRVEGDVGKPNLSDVTVLVVNGIQACVVTDFNNTCVKSFYTRNNQPCHSRLPLVNSPWGATQLKENQVMVAVPDYSQIVTVEVTPDLVLLSTITTSRWYYSLAVLSPSSLAAGTYYCVDILDMGGHVLRSVDNQIQFTRPFCMCVNNKGNILVSDCEKKSVTCVTSEGDVVWRYAPTGDRALIFPCGITTTSTGDILLADRYTNKVIQLTESGEYVRDVLTSQDGVPSLRGLWSDNHGSIFVTGDGKIKEFINT